MSVTSTFVKEFKPADQTHVEWFKTMTDAAEHLTSEQDKPTDIVALINTNPMNIKIGDKDVLDWFHIHFVLCAVYAKAVLKGAAFIPRFS
jgi:hypothetical protein